MKYWLIAAALFSAQVLATSPSLSGKIIISVENGTIDADFTLSDLPQPEKYYLFINSGMNIQYFRDEQDEFNYAYRKHFNTELSYESFGYFLPDETGEGTFLPKTLRVKYSGKYPVIADMEKASDLGDWKGNIAFNGKTVRADGLQTGWYPVLYDTDKDKRFYALRYDIEVECMDCKSLYVNGSKPVSGHHARFKSDKPVELMLFAGDFDIAESSGSYIFNSPLSETEKARFGQIIASFQEFYNENLLIPYGDDITFVNTTPVTRKNSWFFVSYPTVVRISPSGNGFRDIIAGSKSGRFQQFIAHELAHYYFGTYRTFNSQLGDMFRESFAEYMSLKLTRTLIDEEVYQSLIRQKLKKLKDKSLPAISAADASGDYGNRELYVYHFAPVVWLLLESEIGEENMWKWMNLLLTEETDFTDYAFMRKTLATVLNDSEQMEALSGRYFETSDFTDIAEQILPESQTTN